MIDPVALCMRWAHILSAITALGGALFLRAVLMPAASSTLSPEEHGRLRAALLPRWKHIVHTCIALFLISGLFNYLTITRHQHEGQALYSALIGIKILVAFAVFFLAIALTSSSPVFAGIHAKRARWLTVLILLAAAVVLISGILRALPHTA